MFDTEHVRCDLCNSDEAKIMEGYNHAARLPDSVSIMRCRKCGLVYMNPRPTLAAYRNMYEGGEFYQDYQGRVTKYAHLFPQTYEIIEKYKPDKGSLLEVGCATGEFLNVGCQRGWQVIGTDASQSLAEVGKTKYGVEIIVSSSVKAIAWPAEQFDVVYASHVMEHLPSPSATLRELWRVLKPGGLILIQVPNEFEDLLYVLFRWLATKRYKRGGAPIFDHVYFFSPQTMTRMVEQTGFSLLEISTWQNRNRRNFLASRYPGGKYIKRGLFAAGGLIGRGPNIEVIAAKSASLTTPGQQVE